MFVTCPVCASQNDENTQTCLSCGTTLMTYSGYPPRQVYLPSPPGLERTQTDTLSRVGFVMGIIVASFTVIGLVSCLGILNWFTLLLVVISKFICLVAI